jgi:hypothetical protein
MKKVIIIALALSLMNFTSTIACTTMLVTRGASQDGSVIVAHSDDSELFDQRLVYVPAADHKLGLLRPVYYDAAALGDRPEYHGYDYAVMSGLTGALPMKIPISRRAYHLVLFLKSNIPMHTSMVPMLS